MSRRCYAAPVSTIREPEGAMHMPIYRIKPP